MGAPVKGGALGPNEERESLVAKKGCALTWASPAAVSHPEDDMVMLNNRL